MKNILFGLMAVTSVAFAQQPNLGADVSQGSAGTVFAGGQTGEIAVHGKLQANPGILKYVVYASNDGTYDPNGDTVTLDMVTEFSTEMTVDLTTIGFIGTPKKVYVRKVNGTNDNIESLTTETVKWKIQF